MSYIYIYVCQFETLSHIFGECKLSANTLYILQQIIDFIFTMDILFVLKIYTALTHFFADKDNGDIKYFNSIFAWLVA